MDLDDDEAFLYGDGEASTTTTTGELLHPEGNASLHLVD